MTMIAPAIPMRLRTRRRAKPRTRCSSRAASAGATGAATPSASVADAGVEPAIDEVHRQVDEAEDQRDKEHSALHDRIIAVADAVEQKAAHTRQRENGFDDHRAAEQVSDLYTDHRQDRDKGVLQRVAIQDRLLVESF